MVAIFKRNSGESGSLIDSLRDGDYAPYLILFSVVASSLSLLTALSLSVSFHRLASKPPATLVQTNDGAMTVKEQDYLYRSPNNIRDFTGETLTLLLNWNGKTVDKYGKLTTDHGVALGENDRIPTRAYEAASAFTTEGRLRSQVLERVGKWSSGRSASKNTTQRLEIQKIIIPKKLEKAGHWRVDVVSTRVIKQGPHEEPIRFNQSLFVRAVPALSEPVPETATPEEKAFYKIREHGLEIYRMESFTRN